MTNRPYTDSDLRTEAAVALAALGTLPTPADIRRSLPDAYIESRRTSESGREATWAGVLGETGLGVPVGEIHALVEGAADVSEWAVNLGADGLEPSLHVLNLDGDSKPIVRLHMAFDPAMPEGARQRFGLALAQVMANSI